MSGKYKDVIQALQDYHNSKWGRSACTVCELEQLVHDMAHDAGLAVCDAEDTHQLRAENERLRTVDVSGMEFWINAFHDSRKLDCWAAATQVVTTGMLNCHKATVAELNGYKQELERLRDHLSLAFHYVSEIGRSMDREKQFNIDRAMEELIAALATTPANTECTRPQNVSKNAAGIDMGSTAGEDGAK